MGGKKISPKPYSYDDRPVTVRSHCEGCQKSRLFRCKIDISTGLVTATCLTCARQNTK